MEPGSDNGPAAGASPLAQRLKDLRADAGLGQEPVSRAIDVSVPMISAYENGREIPTDDRLRRYAEFFGRAEKRSRELEQELQSLRSVVKHGSESVAAQVGESGADFWRFPDGGDVTVVCAQLPDEIRERMPYTHPDDPDRIRLYSYADPDALLELWGEVKGSNPRSNARRTTDREIDRPKELPNHLIVLGGVDWNSITRRVLREIKLPVVQESFLDIAESAAFVVGAGTPDERRFQAILEDDPSPEGWRPLREDVGLFVRGPNPFNKQRSLTMCNGMYGRGVLGAVLALTDPKLRDRNARLLRELECDRRLVALLFRVRIEAGDALPPDWTDPDILLYQWVQDR